MAVPSPTTVDSLPTARFAGRHIGPQPDERDKMLAALGLAGLDELVEQSVPAAIRQTEPLDLPPAWSESETLAELRRLAETNNPLTPMIGLGYYGTITPSVIRRNVLESPAWYTAYTPYQPEISQGRLEALLNFQTMVSDLTALPTSGASLLDEATAVAEAMTLARRSTKTGSVFLLDADTLPQTVGVVRTRAAALGLEVVVADGPLARRAGAGGRLRRAGADPGRQRAAGRHRRARRGRRAGPRPGRPGGRRLRPARAHPDHAAGGVGRRRRGRVPASGSAYRCSTAVRTPASSPSAPAWNGRCPAVWSGCRRTSTVPPPSGSPCRPGSSTSGGRRPPPTSAPPRCCWRSTASMYAVYHGPEGLRAIATEIHHRARELAGDLRAAGIEVAHGSFFDTVVAVVPGRAAAVVAAARDGGVHLRLVDADRVGIAVGEDATTEDLDRVRQAFDVRGSGAAAVRGPGRQRAQPRASSPTRCSTPTTARPRCCATCGRCPTGTSRWTAG